MKRIVFVVTLGVLVAPRQAHAQWTVFDPTNFAEAVKTFVQIQKVYSQAVKEYDEVVNQYNLMQQMAVSIKNMPARYQAMFSSWKAFTSRDLLGNNSVWISAANSGNPTQATTGYQQATYGLQAIDKFLTTLSTDAQKRLSSRYSTVELSDGANVNAMSTLGDIRGRASAIDGRISNLEADSFSSDPSLNSEVGVLNKINAAALLTLKSQNDTNKLLVSLLEHSVIASKAARDGSSAAIELQSTAPAVTTSSMQQITKDMTTTLATFTLP
jgi:hypothetical protein